MLFIRQYWQHETITKRTKNDGSTKTYSNYFKKRQNHVSRVTTETKIYCHEGTRNSAMTETGKWRLKTYCICQLLPGKNFSVSELELLAVFWVLERFRFRFYTNKSNRSPTMKHSNHSWRKTKQLNNTVRDNHDGSLDWTFFDFVMKCTAGKNQVYRTFATLVKMRNWK